MKGWILQKPYCIANMLNTILWPLLSLLISTSFSSSGFRYVVVSENLIRACPRQHHPSPSLCFASVAILRGGFFVFAMWTHWLEDDGRPKTADFHDDERDHHTAARVRQDVHRLLMSPHARMLPRPHLWLYRSSETQYVRRDGF